MSVCVSFRYLPSGSGSKVHGLDEWVIHGPDRIPKGDPPRGRVVLPRRSTVTLCPGIRVRVTLGSGCPPGTDPDLKSSEDTLVRVFQGLLGGLFPLSCITMGTTVSPTYRSTGSVVPVDLRPSPDQGTGLGLVEWEEGPWNPPEPFSLTTVGVVVKHPSRQECREIIVKEYSDGCWIPVPGPSLSSNRGKMSPHVTPRSSKPQGPHGVTPQFFVDLPTYGYQSGTRVESGDTGQEG